MLLDLINKEKSYATLKRIIQYNIYEFDKDSPTFNFTSRYTFEKKLMLTIYLLYRILILYLFL